MVVSLLASFLVIFVSTQMQLKSFLEKVDELTKCATQNAEDISVLKTKIRELDNFIQEIGVKIGLTPKETVNAIINLKSAHLKTIQNY